jgi:hypothetical protein
MTGSGSWLKPWMLQSLVSASAATPERVLTEHPTWQAARWHLDRPAQS